MNRDIYPYHNGCRDKFGDPLAIWRSFFRACDGAPNEWLDFAGDETQPIRQADYAEKVLAAGRTAFGMIPFDQCTGEGATDEQVFGVIEGFLDWFDQKKTDLPESLQTSTRPTAA